MIKPDTATCDVCGREYEFTSSKDRCPVCCPKPESEPDAYKLDDWGERGLPVAVIGIILKARLALSYSHHPRPWQILATATERKRE